MLTASYDQYYLKKSDEHIYYQVNRKGIRIRKVVIWSVYTGLHVFVTTNEPLCSTLPTCTYVGLGIYAIID